MDRLWTKGLEARAASGRMQGTRQPRWCGMEQRYGTHVPGGREMEVLEDETGGEVKAEVAEVKEDERERRKEGKEEKRKDGDGK